MSLLNKVVGVGLAVVVALAPGCATLVASGPAHVPVTSRPAGAAVFVNDEWMGKTPMVVDLKPDLPTAAVRLELPGFASTLVRRDRKLNGWVFGNILLGGVIGVAIDVATGAAHRYDDAPVDVALVPGTGTRIEAPAPPPLSDADCKAERHRIFVDAMQIQDPALRMKQLRTAPVCK